MNQKEQLQEKLKEIDRILRDTYQDHTEIGVLSGISGLALFQFYYGKLLGEESNTDVGAEMLSLVIQKINEGYSYHTFCTGISGAAWAMELLKQEGFIDLDTDALFSELDDFLVASMERTQSEIVFYDFLHGSIGVGYYFLKRYQNTQSAVLKTRYKKILLRIVAALDESAQKDSETARWESFLIKEDGLRGFNLSLSHGISSIINFLSRLVIYDDFYTEVKDLLQQSVRYVLSLKSIDTSSTSAFPNWVTLESEKSDNTRLAWCYGDLGVGLSLWKAGKALNNISLSETAIAVLVHSTQRRDLAEAKVIDAGLCHGTFGIMHIYNYMYTETQEVAFKEAADFWMQEALNMAVHKNGHAGYMQWKAGETNGWKKESNLLEGIAGIGLSIISYLAPFDTQWDECLLMS